MRKAFGDFLTEDILNKKKQGFGAPVAKWLKLKEMESFTEEILKNPTSKIYQFLNFNEVQKYLSNTGHVYNANVFLVSKVFWDKCTDQEKEIIKKAAIEARDYQRKLNEEEDQSSVKLLTEKGMKINDLNPGEKEKIMEMAQPLYESVAKSIGGDLVDRSIAAAK